MKKTILLFLTSLIVVSCSDTDVIAPVDKKEISAESIVYLHENASKKWKITNYYSNYESKVLDEDLMSCIKDDVYTFFNDKEESEIVFGDSSCYAGYKDEYEETSVATYAYYSEDKKLYLYFGRGAYFTEKKIQSAWSIVTSCEYISADKMIFTNGIEGSGVGIVFEVIK